MSEKLYTGGIGPNLLPYSGLLQQCLNFLDNSLIKFPHDVGTSPEAQWKYLCTHQEAMISFATHVDTLIRWGKISIDGVSVDDARIVSGESGALLNKRNATDARLGACGASINDIRRGLRDVVNERKEAGVVWEASPSFGKYNCVKLLPENEQRTNWLFSLTVLKPGTSQKLERTLTNVNEKALAEAFSPLRPWRDTVTPGWVGGGDKSKVPGAVFLATRTISFTDQSGTLRKITWNVRHTNPSTHCPSSMSSWIGHTIDDTLEIT